MRLLIDGYNVMHAAGLMNRRFGADGLRRRRDRFLHDLAAALGPEEARETTVVFDASTRADHLPAESVYKGMAILYAIDDEDADARIERLIAQHPVPRSLTVISSDRRIRRAARRRKAGTISADDFLLELQDHPHGPHSPAPPPPPPTDAEIEAALRHPPDDREAAYWLDQFRDLTEDPEVVENLAEADPPALLTDDDIARIEREVEEELSRRGSEWWR